METCDPEVLAQSGKVFNGLDEGQRDIIELQLLCEILGASGGGTPIPPGTVNPNGNVTGSPGQTYFNSANSTFWVQNSATTGNTGWVQLI